MDEKILIVDDEPNVLEGLQRVLRKDFTIVAAIGGEAGLKAVAEQGPFAVIVSDMRMPGMSGLELHNRLVEAGAPIPTILMTAFPNNIDEISALQTGVVGYLTKPFNETELLGLIHSVLKRF